MKNLRGLLDEVARLLSRLNDILFSQFNFRTPHNLILNTTAALSSAWNELGGGGKDGGSRHSVYRAIDFCLFAVHHSALT